MPKTGRQFMEKTKYQNLTLPDQELDVPQPPLELSYPGDAAVIELPAVDCIRVKEVSLRQAIERRKSVREYARIPLSQEELAYLLWCTQGVKAITPRPATIRNVPSAGARHALETYLLVNNVTGLNPGIYRYLALEHELLPISLSSGLAQKVAAAAVGQDFVVNSAVTFIWTAVIYRMKWRYGERGYRYIHLDAGHVCQNLYLAAHALACGVCAIGAFDDDALNALLGLDGEEHFAVYLAAVGKEG